MNKITLIAAIGKNRELGLNNQLIWRIPEDLRFFKENTINKTIVMGLNTFNSLPHMLPKRKHIVLTSKNLEIEDVIIVHSLDELLEYISNLEEVMIIGGASIYSQLINYADELLLTEIDDSKEADAYFPDFDKNDWESKVIGQYQYEDIKYKRLVYKRK